MVGSEAFKTTVSLSLQYCKKKKNQTVANSLSTMPLNISFRRALVGDKLRLWHELVSKILSVTLSDANDSFKWTLTKNSDFTMKSMYKDLMQMVTSPYKSIVWKLKVSLKIKVFIWYIQRGVILTKDNLLKRRWKGGSKCCFCSKDETIHLFFSIVMWHSLCGMPFSWPLESNHLLMLLTCLAHG